MTRARGAVVVAVVACLYVGVLNVVALAAHVSPWLAFVVLPVGVWCVFSHGVVLVRKVVVR